ncbi:carbon-nitrogen hydrolase family protein [Rhodococcus jostii]|uniref:Carbon-nitrogen hydrolase family protein n=1 Tax=Rhodococcus jostii TaxID=132919 RepID=A0ABU4CSB5_RHOJO|nr:carbon-nitrogen hydrolase family protein [Rhodococcus jostii]MDV6286474.1 carbon-nitrogen hydrolase family protein [Rhodococcus jostii]
MTGSSSSTRVAVAQMRSGTDVAANRASIVALTEQAAAAGAQLVAFPEYATYLGPDTAFADVAESIESGPTVTALRDLARQHNISILLGSMVESGADGALHNTSVFVDARGEVAAAYRKVHLFTSTIAGASGSESDRITPGTQLTVVRWSDWNLGLSICFDVRFPELYRELAAMKADVLTIPAAFTTVTGKDHWDVLLRARAIENQAYVIAPAQIGKFDGGESFGRSCVIDPWGTVLAVVGDGDGEGIAVADIKRARLQQVRTDLPALANRRFARADVSELARTASPANAENNERSHSCVGFL